MSFLGGSLDSIGDTIAGPFNRWFGRDNPEISIDAPKGMKTGQSKSDYEGVVEQSKAAEAGYSQQLRDWLNSREGYYAQLYGGMQQAGAGQLADQAADAKRQQGYAAIRAGNQGGSADLYTQAGIERQHAAGLGQLESQARQATEAQRAGDLNQAESWYNLYAGSPGEASALQAEMAASQARAGLAPAAAGAAQQAWQNQLGGAAVVSSALGSSLSNIGSAVNLASQLGYFRSAAPQQQAGDWVSALRPGMGITNYGNGGFGISTAGED